MLMLLVVIEIDSLSAKCFDITMTFGLLVFN